MVSWTTLPPEIRAYVAEYADLHELNVVTVCEQRMRRQGQQFTMTKHTFAASFRAAAWGSAIAIRRLGPAQLRALVPYLHRNIVRFAPEFIKLCHIYQWTALVILELPGISKMLSQHIVNDKKFAGPMDDIAKHQPAICYRIIEHDLENDPTYDILIGINIRRTRDLRDENTDITKYRTYNQIAGRKSDLDWLIKKGMGHNCKNLDQIIARYGTAEQYQAQRSLAYFGDAIRYKNPAVFTQDWVGNADITDVTSMWAYEQLSQRGRKYLKSMTISRTANLPRPARMLVQSVLSMLGDTDEECISALGQVGSQWFRFPAIFDKCPSKDRYFLYDEVPITRRAPDIHLSLDDGMGWSHARAKEIYLVARMHSPAGFGLLPSKLVWDRYDYEWLKLIVICGTDADIDELCENSADLRLKNLCELDEWLDDPYHMLPYTEKTPRVVARIDKLISAVSVR